jgi:hypothetical protein
VDVIQLSQPSLFFKPQMFRDAQTDNIAFLWVPISSSLYLKATTSVNYEVDFMENTVGYMKIKVLWSTVVEWFDALPKSFFLQAKTTIYGTCLICDDKKIKSMPRQRTFCVLHTKLKITSYLTGVTDVEHFQCYGHRFWKEVFLVRCD